MSKSVTHSEGNWPSPNMPVKLDSVSFMKETKSVVSGMFMLGVASLQIS